MTDDGLPWNQAWHQVERETGTRPKTEWPYVVLGVSIGIILTVAPILMVAALILVGYGSMTDGEALIFNGLGIVLLVSWIAIPVSVLAIALKQRHSKSGVLVAGLGMAAWVAVSVWMFAGSV